MFGDLIKPPSEDEEDDSPFKPRPVRLYRTPFYKRGWVRWMAMLGVGGLFFGSLALLLILKPHRDKALSFNLEEMRSLERASVIYDRKNREIGRIFVENRQPISIDDVPLSFIDALIATEDSRFRTHEGVDYLGILRAVLKNIQGGFGSQGASTITQQLARNAFELSGKTIDRKLTEAFLAHRIEQHYGKQEILEFYLNRIYFGSGFHGIESAAQGYFGKSAKDLSIDESAIICGLIKFPNGLSPIKNPEGSKRERNYVLNRMRTEKIISPEECTRLKALPIKISPRRSVQNATYAEAYIRQQVRNEIGLKNASASGYQIYTTIDLDVQSAAQDALREQLERVEKETPDYRHQTYEQYLHQVALAKQRDQKPELPEYLQGACMMVENRTGAIVAMVGGRDFDHSEYNRALLTRRPGGTAFTPFVFAAAFEGGGMFPGSLVPAGPVNNTEVMIGGTTGILGEWGAEEPTTWKQEESAREALVGGRISPSFQVGKRAGLTKVKALAAKAGFPSDDWKYPSTFLGAREVKLSEMCLGYTAFPNGGKRAADYHIISLIRSFDGEKIFDAEEVAQEAEVMDPVAAFQVHSCLEQAIREGTSSLALTDYDLDRNGYFAGKTGTHYDSTDLWFMGYDSAVTCGVWVGFDANRTTIYPDAYSKDIALPVWTKVMNASLETFPSNKFPAPKGAETIEICSISGLRATETCYETGIDFETGRSVFNRCTYTEIIRPGEKMQRYCEVHGGGAPRPHQIADLLASDSKAVATGSAEEEAKSIPVSKPTIIGFDPYNSKQPLLRALPTSELLLDSMDKAIKAIPTKMGSDKARIRLEPPEAIDFD
ncbi:transglycosylase domain-containing protein [Verrucomicrobiales bacterium]|nr:transglycosylase domain-containing protein [Verrucomicrobiales bacterium]